jgi:hypothetical protein
LSCSDVTMVIIYSMSRLIRLEISHPAEATGRAKHSAGGAKEVFCLLFLEPMTVRRRCFGSGTILLRRGAVLRADPFAASQETHGGENDLAHGLGPRTRHPGWSCNVGRFGRPFHGVHVVCAVTDAGGRHVRDPACLLGPLGPPLGPLASPRVVAPVGFAPVLLWLLWLCQSSLLGQPLGARPLRLVGLTV